jgi:hypothetical protein
MSANAISINIQGRHRRALTMQDDVDHLDATPKAERGIRKRVGEDLESVRARSESHSFDADRGGARDVVVTVCALAM